MSWEYPVMMTDGLGGVLADPFVQTGIVAAIGALVTRTLLRSHPTYRFAGQLLFLALLTGLLLYHGIVPYEVGPHDASVFEQVFIGVAKIIWWINAAWALIGFVRVFLIFERQPREGKLIQDLLIGVVYVGVFLSVVAYVFEAPVGTLIATSGVFAIIIGLALQSTLNDVFSGIALNLGRPYQLGDHLVLDDGIEGRVVETNWRATHILSRSNDLVVIPNSNLAKARLINISGPESSHGATLTVRLAPTVPPSAMLEAMHAALLSSTSILFVPAPSVHIKGLDGTSVELELSFRVSDVTREGDARNELYDLVYRHVKAAGLVLTGTSESSNVPSLPRSTSRRLLDALPLFASLTDDEKEALAGTMTHRAFRKGEVLAEQGSVSDALGIIRSGVVSITASHNAHERELGRLAPGDCFGEGGLLVGTGEPGTVKALTPVVVYEIAKHAIAPLLAERPAIADELGSILFRRTETERHLLEPGTSSAGSPSATGLTIRIRQLFGLSHL
jgi:small-conductance mechanosensitive channel